MAAPTLQNGVKADLATLKERTCKAIDELAHELTAAADDIWAHPEIALQEVRSSGVLVGLLEKHGLEVERNIADLPTAFRSHLGGAPDARPHIAILAEYDALPGVGHGCGHNIIGTAAIGAALGLVTSGVLSEVDGSASLVGCPAEESTVDNSGGKCHLTRAGIFDETDAAIMMHPGLENSATPTASLAARSLDFVFTGKPAHAAASPHEGINALNGVIQLINSVNALRQHLKQDVRIHYIITDGGQAVNIVPMRAACRIRIRSFSTLYRDETIEKVKRCAEGAAQATGSTVEIRDTMPGYDAMIPIPTLAKLMRANMEELDLPMAKQKEKDGSGSTDLGNVSRVTPAMTAMIAIADKGVQFHSHEFASAAGSDRGRSAVINGAKVLAMTALDLLHDHAAVRAARKELDRALKAEE